MPSSKPSSNPQLRLVLALFALGIALSIGAASPSGYHHASIASAETVTTTAADSHHSPAEEVPNLYDDTVVREVRITFASDDWLALLQANGCRGFGGPGGGQPGGGTAAKDVPATVEVDGTRLEQVGIRCKGNSSLSINGSKKPLNLTIDAFQAGQDLWGFDVLNLDNNFNDPSQLRAAIGLRLLANYAPVPRFAFARVTINGDYVGLYTVVEQVNGEWADHWFDDSGLIIRGDSPVRIAFESSTLNWKGEDLAAYRQGYEVKGQTDDDAGYERLRELVRALDAPEANGGLSAAAFPEGIRRQMNVDSALWYIAGTNILAHYDSYYVGKNYYLFAGERDPRFNVVNWDLGLAFGTFGYRAAGAGGGPGGGGTNAALVDPFVQEDAASRPLVRRLLAVPEFRADYLAHYRTLLDDVFTEEWITEVGQSYQDLVKDAVKAEADAQGNVSGSFTYEQFLANLRDPITPSGGGGRPGGGGRGIPGVLALVRDRRAYLVARPDMKAPDLRLAARSVSPEAPATGDVATIRATFEGADAAGLGGVQLRYRVAGGFEEVVPMTRDGGDWTATVPAQRAGRRVTYAFRAAAADGRVAFFPEANWTAPFHYDVTGVDLPVAPPGDLALNELMADNTATLADEAGEFEDWIELYNRGAAPIVLGGMYLSDDPADPWAFALPDQALAPGEHLLVWCDGDLDQGPLHAPFGLSRQGESLVLSSREATLDKVDFGPLGTDQSLGRTRDGAADWALCGAPSPRRANTCHGSAPPPTNTPEPSPSPEPTNVPVPTATEETRRGVLFLPWAMARE